MLNWIEIDGDALRHNFRLFAEICGQERLAPVLKANAYGHGLSQVFEQLKREKPHWLCVNYVEEAAALRKLGFAGRILVVGPFMPDRSRAFLDAQAEPVIGNRICVDAIKGTDLKVHIKLDTGMSRQGFVEPDFTDLPKLLAPIQKNIAGVSTHFANVEDVTKQEFALAQLASFKSGIQILREAGFEFMTHAASSASAMLFEDSLLDLCRVGISSYGLWPSQATRISFLQHHKKLVDLKPAMTWKTRITTLKSIPAGQFVGYGCTFRAVSPMVIAVLPVGYNEGYPRLAGDPASYVLVRGKRCPLVGRICMNMMMIDVSHVEGVCFDDTVTLIGTDQSETVSADDIAGWAQTINYELVTRINPDIERRPR